MVRGKHKLTARMVEQIKTPGVYADGEGLFLQMTVGRDGRPRRSWLVRYTTLGGQRREMGLGRVELLDLADAREAAVDARKLAKAGIDPIAKRQTDRVEAARQHAEAITFKECATAYLASRDPRWKSAKHGKFWSRVLERSAYPILGALPVGAVDKALVLQVLEPIWNAKPVTASRLRGHIEAVLSWATAHGHRSGDNPARWRGHLEHALVSPKLVHQERHHPALPWADMPDFYASLCGRSGAGADCLRYVILTAARFSEAAGMRWGEIDFGAATWTVPKERMGKTGKPHRVALSSEAISVLMLRKQRARSVEADALVFESDLRRSARLRAIFEVAGPGLADPDRDGRVWLDLKGRITSWQDAGWSLEEDVLPVVKARSVKGRKNPMFTFQFLEQDIATHHALRKRPAPLVQKGFQRRASASGATAPSHFIDGEPMARGAGRDVCSGSPEVTKAQRLMELQLDLARLREGRSFRKYLGNPPPEGWEKWIENQIADLQHQIVAV